MQLQYEGEGTSPGGLWAELLMAGPRWKDIIILLEFVSQGCIAMIAFIVMVEGTFDGMNLDTLAEPVN